MGPLAMSGRVADASPAASQHAPRTEGQRPIQGVQPVQSTELNWKHLKDDLESLERDLRAEAMLNPRYARAVSTILTRVSQLEVSTREPSQVEKRLDRIETLLRTEKGAGSQTPVPAPSWAAIAAQSTRDARVPHVTQRPTVRAKIPEATKMTTEEVLREAKKVIPSAVAVRMLRSGDVDITVPNEEARLKAQALPPAEGMKVYKKDFLIEVPGVPLKTRVVSEKGANNTLLVFQIAAASS